MIRLVGGGGFVGSGLARYCARRGLPHTVVTRANYAEHVGRRADLLVLAHASSKKVLARERPLADFDESTRSVRAALLDFPAERVLLVSSCDVYPDCSSPMTTREDAVVDVTAQSPYGFHKWLAEECVRHAARHWLVVRYGGFVGPGLKKNAIFDILKGGPLWLDPASRLQFLHTDDAARLTFALLDRGLDREVVNLCGRGLVELSEVAAWAGGPVPVQPGSPTVRYDASIEKVSRLVDVPETRATVRAFVGEAREEPA